MYMRPAPRAAPARRAGSSAAAKAERLTPHSGADVRGSVHEMHPRATAARKHRENGAFRRVRGRALGYA